MFPRLTRKKIYKIRMIREDLKDKLFILPIMPDYIDPVKSFYSYPLKSEFFPQH